MSEVLASLVVLEFLAGFTLLLSLAILGMTVEAMHNRRRHNLEVPARFQMTRD